MTSIWAPYSNNAVNGSTVYGLHYNKEVPSFKSTFIFFPNKKTKQIYIQHNAACLSGVPALGQDVIVACRWVYDEQDRCELGLSKCWQCRWQDRGTQRVVCLVPILQRSPFHCQPLTEEGGLGTLAPGFWLWWAADRTVIQFALMGNMFVFSCHLQGTYLCPLQGFSTSKVR